MARSVGLTIVFSLVASLLVIVAPIRDSLGGPEIAEAAVADAAVTVRGNTWRIRRPGTTDIVFTYGSRGDIPIMGDWNRNGQTTPGVVRGNTWFLRNSRTGGNADIVFTFGRAGDVPVVGDWNGDGRTSPGLVRGTTWYLRNSNTSGAAEVSFAYGTRGDVPVAGDWNGDRVTTPGVVRGNVWYLRDRLTTGYANRTLTYGAAGDVPIVGDWNGNGVTGIGVVAGTAWRIRNSLTTGDPTARFVFGACGDVALTTSSARTTPGVPPTMIGTEWTVLPTNAKVVALTFDAGANAAGLRSILDTLARKGAPATFFLTGNWVNTYPTSAREIASRYPVGNHTATHPDLTTLSDAAVRDQVVRAHQTIRTTTGAEPRPWFRFPYGARDTRTIGVVNCLEYGSVRWTVDTLGWKGTSGGQSVTTVRNRVLDNLRPGMIVLMHIGSHPQDRSTLDADALPRLIDDLRARGYTLVDLTRYG
jgi:peptidoglycan/xylan/chitin deacetylase (PgdA/CDA1 family)